MASVAVTPGWTVEEYLKTPFRPDVDFVDGQIEERNLGEFDHGLTQGALFETLRRFRAAGPYRVALDTRMQVSAHRFRVPDVCLTDGRYPKEQVIRRAPLLCLEVVSPEDTLPRLWKRSEDYFAMGVPEVWIFDPGTRTAYVRRDGVETVYTTGVISLQGTPVAIDVEEIFQALDDD